MDHRALYQVFLEVRDAAAKILEHTTLADLINRGPAGSRTRSAGKKKAEAIVLQMLVQRGGQQGHD